MKTLMFSLSLFLFGLLVPAPAQAHTLADDGAFNAIKAFTKLQSKSGKLLDKIKPWNDLMKQNESLIPTDIKPRYDDFNNLLDGFNGSMAKFSADPASLTEEAFKGLNGDLGKIGSEFAQLKGLTKGLPFMAGN